MLDSDLQIRGGHSMMTKEDDLDRQARAKVRVNADFRKGFARVVEPYLDTAEALASDDFATAKRAIADLSKHTAGFDPRTPQEARDVYLPLGERVSSQARRAAEFEDIDSIRRSFAEIAKAMNNALERFGNPLETELTIAFCPMAQNGKGAKWGQRSPAIRNPYFGASMLKCGEVSVSLPSLSVIPPSPRSVDAPKPKATPPPRAPKQKLQKKQSPPLFTCPMHPQVEASSSGKCPICKMDLVPKGGAHVH